MLRIAIRMLLDQPSKSLGTLLGVVVSTFLMAQQLSTFLGILDRVSGFADRATVDVWIASPTTQDTDLTETVPTRYLAVAASTEGVASAAPIVQGMTFATRPDGARELVKLVGVEGPRFAGLPRSLTAGTVPAHLAGPGRVLISELDRPLYGDPPRGARLQVGGRTMTLAGWFDGVDPHANYGYVFVSVADARAVTGMPDDRATFVAVQLAPGHRAEDVAARLRARLPDARVLTRAELVDAQIHVFMDRTPVGLVFGMGAIVAALVGSLIVGVTMFSSVVDRLRDFGALRAIGATRRDLLTILVAQAFAFFAAGASLGLLVFAVVKHHAPAAPMLAPPWLIAVVAAGALVSCLLASIAAIRRVLAIDPAIVFRG